MGRLINEETLILAKSKGFDPYDEIDIVRVPIAEFIDSGHSDVEIEYHTGITQSLLKTWLREIHNIHITITSISQESWQYHIQKPKDKLGDNYDEDFEDYEEALEDGLQKALKLID